jgi:phage-related protein|tara:strand:- start:32 stop:436 length:405 start_codon:yes stop_codon:yes gene_type:complete
MATAIFKNNGSNITGFSAGVPVDKGFQRTSSPQIHVLSFGDGYEHRSVNGINNLAQTMSVTFSNRPKAEIDALVDFFEDLNGVTKFRMTIDKDSAGSDSNATETIKVVCKSWNQTWAYDNFYTLSATFERVYEA